MFSLLIVTLLTSTLAQFQIDLTLPSFPVKVNPHFASLSLGFDAVAHLFVLYGTNITSMNTIPRVDDILNPKSIALIQTLIKATKDTSGTPLIIKVGGRTADSLYYTTSSKPDWNPNFSLSISPATFYVMRRVSELTGVKWIVNLGMREPSPLLSYNPEIIADVQNIITPLFLYAIQFGNEPDLYFSEGYRPETYSLTDYFNELQAYVDWIKPILPSVKLIGPSFGFRWGSNNLTSFAKASVGSAVSELTVSRFETTDCNILGSPPPPETLATYPSPKTLLFAGQVLTAATNAQKSQTAVFGDYGSATCGRTQGSPSEPFGSALFLLDSLFEMSSKGFGYMNIQASGHSEQSPIYVDTSKYYPITVQAPYYAMLMFNIAKFGPGSSVYGIATSDPLIKVWIALSPNNGDSYSIVVINKNPLGSPVSIQFNLNPTSKVAKMIFLDSPNGIGAVSGSKIGGVDFNNALDNYVTFPVTITNSKIAVSVKPGSASLIRVSAVDQGDLFTDSSRQIALPGLTVGSDGFYVCQTARFCRSDGERLGPMLLSVVLAVVAIASFF